MILVVGPIVIAFAILAIVAPRLFGRLVGITLALLALALIYMVDGQLERPLFPHNYEKSATVR